jgi:hypothetical protein
MSLPTETGETPMPWLSWLPWRFLLRRVAQAHGFLDPIALLAQIEGFAQPSEVQQPIELLRAGVVFHARGLINSRVVQHNLDWVWPYWIERQFDPEDPAFLPRAFSATHVNLTHRNWTAIGRPDCDALPIVDPRGLLTPRFDGWSLEGWVIGDDGERLLPSKAKDCRQVLAMEDGLEVVTAIERGALCLTGAAAVDAGPTPPCCRWSLEAASAGGGWLVLALRPYNPEGVSFIHRLALAATRDAWIVDQRDSICFDQPADRHHLADYRAGDVGIHLHDREEAIEGSCAVGMLTAAAMFRLQPGTPRRITVRIPLELEFPPPGPAPGWSAALRGCCRLEIPDPKVRFLFDAALRTLVLHAPHDVYPGPFTYKRFWFRDAAFIINAMLAVGLHDRAARAIGRFFGRQRSDGYFQSQDGEWDANGAVLWVIDRFAELTGRTIPPAWRQPIVDGARSHEVFFVKRYRMVGLQVIGSMVLSPFIPCDTKATSTHMRSPPEVAAPKSSIHGAWAQEGGTILLTGIFQPSPRSVRQPGSSEADQASRMSSIGCEETYAALSAAPSGKTPLVT